MSPAMEGLLAFTSTVAALSASIAAWRTFMHQRRVSRDEEREDDVAKETELTMAVRELRLAVDRAFEHIHDNEERFRLHDLKCAEIKAATARDMVYVTDTLKGMMPAVETLNKQVAIMARDMARMDTDRKLTG